MKFVFLIFKKFGRLIKNRQIKNLGHLFFSSLSIIRYGKPSKKATIVGVTGTDGKTTTCNLISHLLNQAGKPTAVISTVGATFKGKTVGTGLHVTTPNSMELQKTIKKLVKKGAKYIVLEATSIGLDQHRLAGCQFNVGVLTNLTEEHLDYHQTMKKYKKAKAKLFKKVDIGVLNKDDINYQYFKDQTNPKAEVVSYSLTKPARFKIIKKETSLRKTKFVLQSGRKILNLETNLIGNHNLSNILAAVAAARKLGVSWKTIKKGIGCFPGVIGRMEFIKHQQEFDVIIDFAHTPNALKNSLQTLKSIKKQGKIIAMVGTAGERDFKKRPEMGKMTTQYADLAIFTADDPRHEDVREIINQMLNGAVGENYLIETDRQKAINLAVAKAKPEDTVILFGKGHERSMAYGDEERPWSEHEAVKQALKNL